MSDDHDFKSVRKNYFLINIIVFGIAWANPPLQDLTIANVEIPLTAIEIYVAFGIAYLYYSYRFYQEYIEQIKIVDQNFLNYFWSILPLKYHKVYSMIHEKIYQSAKTGNVLIWSCLDPSKIEIQRKDKFTIIIEIARIDTFSNRNSNSSIKSKTQEMEKIREEFNVQELQPEYKKERNYYLRNNRDYIVLFLPILFSAITVLAVMVRIYSYFLVSFC